MDKVAIEAKIAELEAVASARDSEITAKIAELRALLAVE